jgi:hypothetical protein
VVVRAILILLLGGCASIPTQNQFPEELVSRVAPARPFRSLGAEIRVTQRTIDAVRLAVGSDDQVMAFAHLPQGVHPFMVVVFVRKDEAVDLLMTSVYWGGIQGKWQGSVDIATVESIVGLATEGFHCTKGPVVGALVGAVLIHWVDGEQVVCDGGWGTEAGAFFGDRFQPLADRAQKTYEPP